MTTFCLIGGKNQLSNASAKIISRKRSAAKIHVMTLVSFAEVFEVYTIMTSNL